MESHWSASESLGEFVAWVGRIVIVLTKHLEDFFDRCAPGALEALFEEKMLLHSTYASQDGIVDYFVDGVMILGSERLDRGNRLLLKRDLKKLVHEFIRMEALIVAIRGGVRRGGI